ncbi:hypothetical protein LTR85_011978 [Meristemomyces frigidus]|nr:hypothetical protein LTR85_011978 [Meristemomyces frigidus]
MSIRRKADDKTRVHNITGVSSKKCGQWMSKQFMFAPLRTDDGPAKASDRSVEDPKQLGEIEVALYRVVKIAPSTIQHREHRRDFQGVERHSIPEKCLKGRAISSQAAFSNPEPTRPTTHWDVVYPYGRKPFAEFHFKYRSRKDLQIEGIIARSPSPVPLEERDPEDLTPEELREQVRLLRAREERRVMVKPEKREHSTLSGDGEDHVDLTTSNGTRDRKRHRTSHDSGVEVVDLTGD